VADPTPAAPQLIPLTETSLPLVATTLMPTATVPEPDMSFRAVETELAETAAFIPHAGRRADTELMPPSSNRDSGDGQAVRSDAIQTGRAGAVPRRIPAWKRFVIGLDEEQEEQAANPVGATQAFDTANESLWNDQSSRAAGGAGIDDCTASLLFRHWQLDHAPDRRAPSPPPTIEAVSNNVGMAVPTTLTSPIEGRSGAVSRSAASPRKPGTRGSSPFSAVMMSALLAVHWQLCHRFGKQENLTIPGEDHPVRQAGNEII
jgi:hypothetical protein